MNPNSIYEVIKKYRSNFEKKGLFKKIERLIKKGCDVNEPVYNKVFNQYTTVLIYALDCNLLDIGKLLIENGANVNKISQGKETSFCKCLKSVVGYVKALKNNSDKKNIDEELSEIYNDLYELMKTFKEKKVDVNQPDWEDFFPINYLVEIDRLFEKQKTKENSPFLDIFKPLPNKVSVNGCTPLIKAMYALFIDIEDLKTMVNYGCDTSVLTENKETLLHLLFNRPQLALSVQFSRKYQTEENQHIDLIAKFEDLVKFLLDNGIDPLAKDKKGKTCLDILKKNSFFSKETQITNRIIDMLNAHNFDKITEGVTPFTY